MKFECTSTYPRLTFIIKFLPIMNGLILIHIYAQNKLSRDLEIGANQNTIDNQNRKAYKEINILYGIISF